MFNEKRSSMLHGVLLIALFSCAAFYIGEMSFVRSLSFSPMIVGIILGMLYANSLRNNLPETWVPGIQFCSKKILRIGIILYGFRLTFQDVLAIGLPAMLIDVIIVMNSKQTGADVNFAYPSAEIAVMGAEGAVNILFRKADAETKAKELEAYKEKFATPYQAAELGFIDEIIYPRQTRKRLIQALEMTENKMQTNPPKKHGNMPL